MYLADTEGLFDMEKEEDNDMRLTSLVVLLSSYLIFNSTGVIDSKSLD